MTLPFALARNHCFEQGNKRTALEAAILFLDMNGYGFEAPDRPELGVLICRVIEHRFTEASFEDVIRPWVVPLPDEVDE